VEQFNVLIASIQGLICSEEEKDLLGQFLAEIKADKIDEVEVAL